MAITKKPTSATPAPAAETAAAQRFIESAPDGTAKTKNQDEEGVQITLRMSKEQLERITSVAKRQGIPRASYIKRAVFIQLEADEKG